MGTRRARALFAGGVLRHSVSFGCIVKPCRARWVRAGNTEGGYGGVMANEEPVISSDTAASPSKNDGGFGVPPKTWKTVLGGIAVWSMILFSYVLGMYLTLFGIGVSINPPDWLPVAVGGVALALGALLIPVGLSFVVVRDSDVASRRTLHWRREAAKRIDAISAAVGADASPPAGSLRNRVSALEERNRISPPSVPQEQIEALTDATRALVAARHRYEELSRRRLRVGERWRVLCDGYWPRGE